MVHHMVQEKHQDKLKTTIIQFIMLTYFLSVIMKDPVSAWWVNDAQLNGGQVGVRGVVPWPGEESKVRGQV